MLSALYAITRRPSVTRVDQSKTVEVRIMQFSSFRQPHSLHSPPGPSHPVHITSSQSPPSLSSPITLSTFHSRLKTHLFHKSFPLSHSSGLTSRILTCTELKGHWLCLFSFWLRVLDYAEYPAFESMLNSLSYRIDRRVNDVTEIYD